MITVHNRTERVFARRLIQLDIGRGLTADQARRAIARYLRINRGTLDGILGGRVKRIDSVIRDRLTELLQHKLRTEITRLTNELEIHRCGTRRLSVEQINEVEALLAKATEILNGSKVGTKEDGYGTTEGFKE